MSFHYRFTHMQKQLHDIPKEFDFLRNKNLFDTYTDNMPDNIMHPCHFEYFILLSIMSHSDIKFSWLVSISPIIPRTLK